MSFQTAEQQVADLVAAGGRNAELHRILDTLQAPSYLTDEEGFIAYCNQACTDFLGRPPNIGRDRWHLAWKLYTAEGNYLPHEYSPMAKAVRSRRPIRGVTVLAARRDGSRVQFAPFATPLFNDSDTFVGAINILVPISEAPSLAELQAQAARSRLLRFSLADHRLEWVFGQVAAEYEASISTLCRAHRSLAQHSQAITLGDLLYAKTKSPELESTWAGLVRRIATGDAEALHVLYHRSHSLVSTLIEKITGEPAKAQQLTLQVFDGIRRRAGRYDSTTDTVLGWIMTQARSWAVDSLRHLPASPTQIGHYVFDPGSGVEEARAKPTDSAVGDWQEPEWETVASGIECKLLANDNVRRRISMLVRLGEGASYPAHTHAGVEELHLLDGELWIDERKLYAGDYNYGAPGAVDRRVFSETGCSCILITSTQDVLR